MKVVGTASLDSVAEKISFILDAESEMVSGTYQFRKKRKLKNSERTFCFMKFDIASESYKESGIALNNARVFLLPDEAPRFTLALLQHPISFPTNFSQFQTINHGVCCIQLESQEAPEQFAERLGAALKLLER